MWTRGEPNPGDEGSLELRNSASQLDPSLMLTPNGSIVAMIGDKELKPETGRLARLSAVRVQSASASAVGVPQT
eukprot:5551191-Prymnesium_polylepis.1